MTDSDLRVDLGDRSYDIAVRSGELASAGAFARQCLEDRGLWSDGRLAFFVTDENVAPHCETVRGGFEAAGFRTDVASVPPGETSKSLDRAAGLFAGLAEATADRRTLVVAVGGGVVGDLAGFAASAWGRGVPFFQVPTSLLAMVDSSVGGKTGVNIPAGKNLVGAFHQPAGVFVDTEVLATLPERELAAGLAEVVKYGVILDAEFFAWLEENADAVLAKEPAAVRHVVTRSCRLKADVVERDEFERTGLRACLNYGHTFGHAYEALLGYGTLLHGEAVAVGMRHAARLAERLGMVDAEFISRQDALLDRFGLPAALPKALSANDVIGRMRVDKKSVDGSLRFVLPERVGRVRLVDDAAESAVEAVLSECLS